MEASIAYSLASKAPTFGGAGGAYPLGRQGILRLRAEPRKTRWGGLVTAVLTALIIVAALVWFALYCRGRYGKLLLTETTSKAQVEGLERSYPITNAVITVVDLTVLERDGDGFSVPEVVEFIVGQVRDAIER